MMPQQHQKCKYIHVHCGALVH